MGFFLYPLRGSRGLVVRLLDSRELMVEYLISVVDDRALRHARIMASDDLRHTYGHSPRVVAGGNEASLLRAKAPKFQPVGHRTARDVGNKCTQSRKLADKEWRQLLKERVNLKHAISIPHDAKKDKRSGARFQLVRGSYSIAEHRRRCGTWGRRTHNGFSGTSLTRYGWRTSSITPSRFRQQWALYTRRCEETKPSQTICASIGATQR